MKNITFLTNNLDVGGSQKVIINLANKAIENGYNVLIISLTSQLFLFDSLNKKVEIEVCSNSLTSSGFLNRIKIFFNLIKILKIRDVKLLHSHLWQIDILYLIFIKIFFNLKIVHTIHSPGSSYLKLKIFDYFNNFIEKIFISKFNEVYVVVVSLEIGIVIKNVLSFNGDVFFIPNGVELLERRKSLNVKEFVFIYPARFQESKGHKYLLEAFKILISKGYNVKLRLLGTGLHENLIDFISYNSLENNVEIVGPVKNVNSYLVDSNFGVFPSFYEGQSLSMCEMMAAGLPIVASNIESNVIVSRNGKGAYLFEVGSVHSLADSMEKLLLNPLLAVRLGQQARLIIKNDYSIDVMFSKYEKLFLY